MWIVAPISAFPKGLDVWLVLLSKDSALVYLDEDLVFALNGSTFSNRVFISYDFSRIFCHPPLSCLPLELYTGPLIIH